MGTLDLERCKQLIGLRHFGESLDFKFSIVTAVQK